MPTATTAAAQGAPRFHPAVGVGAEVIAGDGSRLPRRQRLAADVALDSLAIHRLRLPTSSSLKAREYCARGVPFVLASADADFPPELDFVHRTSSDESALDVSALVSFYERLRRMHPDVHREMRRHAEKSLSWKTKLEPLVIPTR